MGKKVMGAFSVRWHKDGKDGVNVWVKYASVLDKYDSNTDKHYPSKILNEPTAECKYIGIGKGVGDEPTQGQYYDWKKYIGDDGTSFTPKGQAVAHHVSLSAYNSATKSKGLHLVDNTGGALLKYWSGSATSDRSCVDGDGYTTSDKHLWVKDGNTWNDLGEIKGPKGDPGDDAVSYKLSSSISAIPLDNDAYPTVSSFTLTAYKFVGNASATFDDNYTLVAIISYSDRTPITVSTKLGSSSKMTVYLRTGGSSSGSLLKDIKSVTCHLYHGSINLDSFDILPIKAGAAGVSYFPNMCGVWDGANVTYKWTNGSRDMVTFYVGGTPYLFAVKTAGTTIKADVKNATPDKDSRWEKADSPFSMLFANFVYTDNASVAGFIWSKEQMQSQSKDSDGNPNLLLDGKSGALIATNCYIKGIINATNGIFNGEIIAKSGTLDNCTINETCKAGFMKYATNKFNGNVINCGYVEFFTGWLITESTTLYLPSVSEGEYMKIIVANFVTTKIAIPDFTLAVEGNGTLHDLFDYPLGVYTKKTLPIGRMAYYEFAGINEQGRSRWICTNSMFT